MSHALHISDDLFAKLEVAARAQGLRDVTQLLEAWQRDDAERRRRAQAVAAIDAQREQLQRERGEFSDSTALVREDRER